MKTRPQCSSGDATSSFARAKLLWRRHCELACIYFSHLKVKAPSVPTGVLPFPFTFFLFFALATEEVYRHSINSGRLTVVPREIRFLRLRKPTPPRLRRCSCSCWSLHQHCCPQRLLHSFTFLLWWAYLVMSAPKPAQTLLARVLRSEEPQGIHTPQLFLQGLTYHVYRGFTLVINSPSCICKVGFLQIERMQLIFAIHRRRRLVASSN